LATPEDKYEDFIDVSHFTDWKMAKWNIFFGLSAFQSLIQLLTDNLQAWK